MEFKTHNTGERMDGVSISEATDLLATYKELCETFGKPLKYTHENSDGKTDVEWEITFADGTLACIWNWKNGKNYLGAAGQAVENITKWSLGTEVRCLGNKNLKALTHVLLAIAKNNQSTKA